MQHNHAVGHAGNPIPLIQKEPTSLDLSIGEMHNQLSRFFNSLNRLDALADKLQKQPTPLEKPPKAEIPITHTDHCGKLRHQNGVFNGLNNRFESLLDALSRII